MRYKKIICLQKSAQKEKPLGFICLFFPFFVWSWKKLKHTNIYNFYWCRFNINSKWVELQLLQTLLRQSQMPRKTVKDKFLSDLHPRSSWSFCVLFKSMVSIWKQPYRICFLNVCKFFLVILIILKHRNDNWMACCRVCCILCFMTCLSVTCCLLTFRKIKARNRFLHGFERTPY